MIIYLKSISEQYFWFSINANVPLSTGGFSESNQTLGHSEGTWAIEGHLLGI